MHPEKRSAEIDRVARDMYLLSHVVQHAWLAEVRDLSRAAFTTLGALLHSGPLSIKVLAEQLGVDQSVASRHVTVLIEKGYAEAKRDPEDGRSRLIKATTEGREKMLVVHGRIVEAIDGRLASWSSKDLEALFSVFPRLADETQEALGDRLPSASLRKKQDAKAATVDAVAANGNGNGRPARSGGSADEVRTLVLSAPSRGRARSKRPTARPVAS